MKAWDALALGVPVITTSVPPATSWPAGLATITDDPASFASAVLAALTGLHDDQREARLEYASRNRWRDRIELAHEVLDGAAVGRAAGRAAGG